MIRHIVLFRYRESAQQIHIDQLTTAFLELKSKIPEIIAIEHGTNDSPEEKNMGFSHGFQLTFQDHNARDVYLSHPDHAKFGELLDKLDIVAAALVFDYQVM